MKSAKRKWIESRFQGHQPIHDIIEKELLEAIKKDETPDNVQDSEQGEEKIHIAKMKKLIRDGKELSVVKLHEQLKSKDQEIQRLKEDKIRLERAITILSNENKALKEANERLRISANAYCETVYKLKGRVKELEDAAYNLANTARNAKSNRP